MRVHHAERCPPNPMCQGFVAWWNANGPFDIVIITGTRDDAEQLVDYAKGRKQLADGSWVVVDQESVVTNAQTAEDSGHGHDAAFDANPVRELFPNGNVKSIYLGDPRRETPDVCAEGVRRLKIYDSLAKQYGLETGENYPGICDRPHVCDKNWKNLPLAS